MPTFSRDDLTHESVGFALIFGTNYDLQSRQLK